MASPRISGAMGRYANDRRGAVTLEYGLLVVQATVVLLVMSLWMDARILAVFADHCLSTCNTAAAKTLKQAPRDEPPGEIEIFIGGEPTDDLNGESGDFSHLMNRLQKTFKL